MALYQIQIKLGLLWSHAQPPGEGSSRPTELYMFVSVAMTAHMW
jgi:hypothetical protein